jgi:hypothetical protein
VCGWDDARQLVGDGTCSKFNNLVNCWLYDLL